MAEAGDVKPRTVIKRNGETWIEGLTLIGEFEERLNRNRTRMID